MQYRHVLKVAFVSLLFARAALASPPTITVASPKAGAVGTPTYFDATASTSTCPAGISTMRIYTAPGVAAYTTNSPHLETFLNLKAGSYSTVIQAWDNCGGVNKVPIPITVSGAAGVNLFLPSGTSSTTPVHFAASAENSACSGGISAMRIYPSPGVNAFTSSGSTLDAFINLQPGTYNGVAQAWDKCGHVFKKSFTIASTGGAFGKFLYLTDTDANDVALYQLNAGTLINPNGANNPPPTFPVPNTPPETLAIDPPGNLLYVGLNDGRVSIFSINRANGRLQSQGTLASTVNGGPASVAVDRSGNFLLVANKISNTLTSYRINRSNGSLKVIGTVSTGAGPDGVTTDWSGHYAYAVNYGSDDVSGYNINTMTGQLTPVSGSPFLAGSQPSSIGATSHVVYTLNPGNATASGYTISSSTGSLSDAPGSPFAQTECCAFPNMMDLDPIHNLLFRTAIGFTFGTDSVQSYVIASDGAISYADSIGGVFAPAQVALDPSYQFIYTTQTNGYTGHPQVVSIKYGSSGSGGIFSGPLARPFSTTNQIAVSR